MMDKSKFGSFISMGTPRGVTLTSLDKYLDETIENGTSLLQKEATSDEQSDIIASLQKEQLRLTEELNTERKRSESLKATFTSSLSQEASVQKKKLANLRNILIQDGQNPVIIEALRFIGDIETDNRQDLELPKVNDLAAKAKTAEQNVAKKHEENQNLKNTIRGLMAERDNLTAELEELNSQIEATAESRHQIKQKLKGMAATYKQKDADWKERVTKLEAEIEAQRQPNEA